MTKTQARTIITVNLALWMVALLLRPLFQMLPTGSGAPPKIFELLISIFFIMLAGASTYLLKAVIGTTRDD